MKRRMDGWVDEGMDTKPRKEFNNSTSLLLLKMQNMHGHHVVPET